jgi:hypothetical protein
MEGAGSIAIIATITMTSRPKPTGRGSKTPAVTEHKRTPLTRAGRSTTRKASHLSSTLRDLGEVIHELAAHVGVARRRVASAASEQDRQRGERRVRLLHGAIVLLRHVASAPDTIERADRAVVNMLKELGVDDLYAVTDRRGHVAAKKVLLKAMATALQRQVAQSILGDTTPSNAAIEGQLGAARVELGREQESAVPSELSASSPLSHRLAFDFYVLGLAHDAVVPLFGTLDDVGLAGLAKGLRVWGKSSFRPELEDMIGFALWGAGLLTLRQRTEFLGRLP